MIDRSGKPSHYIGWNPFKKLNSRAVLGILHGGGGPRGAEGGGSNLINMRLRWIYYAVIQVLLLLRTHLDCKQIALSQKKSKIEKESDK